MEPNLLVVFVVGALLVLNGVFGGSSSFRAGAASADDQESPLAADDTADSNDDDALADDVDAPGAPHSSLKMA